MCCVAAAHPSAKRSLHPAFDAAAVQAGLPLYDLQPFKPLLLDDAELGLPTPHFTGEHRPPMHSQSASCPHQSSWPCIQRPCLPQVPHGLGIGLFLPFTLLRVLSCTSVHAWAYIAVG